MVALQFELFKTNDAASLFAKSLLHIPKFKKKQNCLLPEALDVLDYWTAAIIVDNGSLGITALPQHAHAKLSVFFMTKRFLH